MSAWKFPLIFASLITFAAGQLLFKRAMETSEKLGFGKSFAKWFVPGVASMTISFFLTLGLLRYLDLSYVYPFQGLNVILISLTAAFLLKEKITLQLALGAILITIGVMLVSAS